MRNKYSVLAASAVIMLCAGIIYVWSIFQPVVVERFSWTAEKASVVFSLIVVCNVLGNIAGGRISDMTSTHLTVCGGIVVFVLGLLGTAFTPLAMPQVIYLTMGIMMSFGSGLAYASVVACAQKWWIDKRGTASGVTTCAFGAATIVMAPLFNWMLRDEVLGFTATFQVSAVAFLVIMIVAALFICDPDEEYIAAKVVVEPKLQNRKQYEPSEILRTKEYYMLLICLLGLPPAYHILNPMFKTLGLTRGLSESSAVTVIMFTGVASASGRLIAPRLVDILNCKKMFYILYALTLTSLICIPFAQGAAFGALVIIISIAFGGCAGVTPVVATEYFGTKNMGTTVSMLLVAVLISGTCFPSLAGMFNADGLPTLWSFLLPGAMAAIGLIVTILLRESGEKVN